MSEHWASVENATHDLGVATNSIHRVAVVSPTVNAVTSVLADSARKAAGQPDGRRPRFPANRRVAPRDIALSSPKGPVDRTHVRRLIRVVVDSDPGGPGVHPDVHAAVDMP